MKTRVGLLRDHFALRSDRSVYLALAAMETRRRAPSHDSGPLTRYELSCFSQNGEDGVLSEVLARVGIEHRWFVEFGIQDGREGNCVFLADVEGWNGLFMEADPGSFTRLSAKYARTESVQTVETVVTPDNLDQLLATAAVPEELDVLSIDVDGQEYWIWESLRRHRPRVLVIEYNSALPAFEPLTLPRSHTGWDGTDYIGSSLMALELLAAQRGYRLVHTELTGLNAFFVRSDLAPDRFPSLEDVPRRVAPNYMLQGGHPPPDPQKRPYDRVAGSS